MCIRDRTSSEHCFMDEELEKLKVAIEAKADAVMDLSTGGDIDKMRKIIIENSTVPVGTVPIYQAAIEASDKKGIVNMSEEEIFDVIEKHAADGVDFMTVHCGDVYKRQFFYRFSSKICCTCTYCV